MSVGLWVILASVVASAAVIVPILVRQVAARGRLARARCGDCDVAFGQQDRPKIWNDWGRVAPGARRHLPINSGPLMCCPRCGKEWPYDGSGRPVVLPSTAD